MPRLESAEKLALLGAPAGALILGVVLVHFGVALAIAAALLPLAVLVILPAQHRGLFAGVILALVLPTWWSLGAHPVFVYRVAALLAVLPLVLGTWRARFVAADLFLVAFVVDSLLSGFLQTAQPGVGSVVLELFLPLTFYAAARTVSRRLQRPLVWALLAGITIGAATVIAERLAGHALFQNAQSYNWAPTDGSVFRPGGVYGSPPAASLALAVGLLLAVSLKHRATGVIRAWLWVSMAMMLAALVLTFERTAMVGLAAGGLVYLFLLGLDARTLLKYAVVAAGVVVAVVIAYPSVQTNPTFQNGVLRPGTFAARTSIWHEELPVVWSSPKTAVFGIGFASTILARINTTTPPPPAIAVDPRLVSTSIHNQYLLILLEQGSVGLAIFLLFLGSVAWLGIRLSMRTRDRLTSGLAGGIVVVLVMSFATTPMLDASSWILSLVLSGVVISRARPRTVSPRPVRGSATRPSPYPISAY
jgi:O-antigen ligase